MKFLKSLSKSQLQKLILTVVICLIILGAIFNFYVLKQIEELTSKGREIHKLNEQITAVQEDMKAEASNAILRNQIHEFVTAQEQRMVAGDSFSWIVRELSLFAEKYPAHVGGLAPGASAAYAPKPQYDTYSTKLEATGTYDQLGQFISELENSFPTCSLRNLGVTIIDAARGECRAAFEMTLLVKPKVDRDKPPAGKATDTGEKKKA